MSISTNVVSVIFGNSRRACGDRILHQRDRGQILTFPDLADQLPSTFQVWFANHPEIGTAVPQTGSGGNVAIPDTLVATGQPIWAWLYLHTGADDGETCYTVTILNTAQPAFTGATPTPAQASAWDEAIEAMNDAIEAAEAAANHGPQIVDGFWYTWDAAAGEYVNTNVPAEGEDGDPGTNIWWTTVATAPNGVLDPDDLHGKSGAVPWVGDYVFGPPLNQTGTPDTLYTIAAINLAGHKARLTRICSIKGAPGDPGADGYAPEVTIEQIDGGHRVTITDEDHPQGQSFDVMDGTGGSGSSDYNDLSNKPQIAGVTLSGDKSLADLGIAAASDIPTVPSAYTSNPAALGTASPGSSDKYARGDHVHAKPTYSKSDVGLGNVDNVQQYSASNPPPYPVTSVNGQTGAVTLSIPSTAADVGAVAANQGVANANKVLTVNSSGVVVPEDDRFVVTFTPTSPDYSGTIDKTPAELAAAYEAGKRIVAYAPAFSFRCELSLATIRSGGLYTFDFIALGELNGQDIMLRLLTDDSSSTFTTKIYPLASGQWTGGSY